MTNMRIFVDTDILLDVLLKRETHFDDSAAIVDWAEENPGSCHVSWHGLANIHYLSKDGAEGFIEDLLCFAEVPTTGTSDMRKALALKFSDLEDSMQVAAAMRAGAQYIITRNDRDYAKSPVKVLRPGQFLDILQDQADH